MARPTRPTRRNDPHANETPLDAAPPWMVSYGDLMTQLVCFFVLIASMGEIRADKRDTLLRSILEQFGDPDTVAARLLAGQGVGSGFAPSPASPSGKEMERHAAPPRIAAIREGRRLAIGQAILFRPGHDDLTPDARRQLDDIIRQLRGKRTLIELRGYAGLDHRPGGRLDDDSLALARLRRVAEYLGQPGALDRRDFRRTIASEREADALPAVAEGPAGFVGLDRVDVLTMEASVEDMETGP